MNSPAMVFGLLGGLCLVDALLVGYGVSPNKGRSWFHPVIFAAILSLTVYVIIDIEFPHLGLIRIDAARDADALRRSRMGIVVTPPAAKAADNVGCEPPATKDSAKELGITPSGFGPVESRNLRSLAADGW